MQWEEVIELVVNTLRQHDFNVVRNSRSIRIERGGIVHFVVIREEVNRGESIFMSYLSGESCALDGRYDKVNEYDILNMVDKFFPEYEIEALQFAKEFVKELGNKLIDLGVTFTADDNNHIHVRDRSYALCIAVNATSTPGMVEISSNGSDFTFMASDVGYVINSLKSGLYVFESLIDDPIPSEFIADIECINRQEYSGIPVFNLIRIEGMVKIVGNTFESLTDKPYDGQGFFLAKYADSPGSSNQGTVITDGKNWYGVWDSGPLILKRPQFRLGLVHKALLLHAIRRYLRELGLDAEFEEKMNALMTTIKQLTPKPARSIM